ncbi:IBR domain-containing protein [Perilla frutescens var. frutescens]|nr:IBR domain-containing protein [Perilla frutescens var. frutescens]
MDSEVEDFYEDDGGDWAEEEDITNEEPDYSAAGSRRKHYKVLTPEEIKQLQENDISTVSDVLSVSRGVACTLLCQNNWSPTSVYENWFAAEERNTHAAAAEPQSGNQICKICYRKTLPKKMVSTTCGHLFCANCWTTYIATAINDGVGCLTLRCPEPGCKAAIGTDTVDMLASEGHKAKYYSYLRRSYVERNRKRKWCPSPGLDRAIEFDQDVSESHDVACDCSFKFCWRCAAESHRPAECKTVAEWLEKNSSEAENTNWILAYTKPCPKCYVAIEKNQGCNHMRCGVGCKFEFC